MKCDIGNLLKVKVKGGKPGACIVSGLFNW